MTAWAPDAGRVRALIDALEVACDGVEIGVLLTAVTEVMADAIAQEAGLCPCPEREEVLEAAFTLMQAQVRQRWAVLDLVGSQRRVQ